MYSNNTPNPAPKPAQVSSAKFLCEEHQAQIKARGLLNDWTRATCRTVTKEEASFLLGYKAKSGGIWISGNTLQAQFRPDKPWKSKEDKKAPKYRTPLTDHGYDAIVPTHPTDREYWEPENLKKICYQLNGHPCVLATEGFFKAIAGCFNDLPTIGLIGVEMGLTGKDERGKRYLIPTLEKIARAGIGVIIAFDADAATNPNINWAQLKLGRELLKFNIPVYIATGLWEMGPEGETKGMDDFIQKRGIEEFRRILARSVKFEDWESEQNAANKDIESKGNKKSELVRLLKLIEAGLGKRLKLNEMSQRIELDGLLLNLEQAYLQIAEELDVDIAKEKAADIITKIATTNTYSPVRDYLNSLENVAPTDLDTLAERYFGTDNPLHAVLLKRTLIAAVARVFKPGCKVDTLCILQGDQGHFKSTFWQILAGEAWFTDNLSEANEKDEKLKLRRYWILEFSEFETAYKRKEVEQLKAFLSSRIDSLRRPYGRAIEDFPRTSVFVGSTNRQEFLHDPTGERRYWVIPVSKKIPIKMLEEERDRIWAAAVAAYKSGEQWWLTPQEDQLLAQANKSWQSSDAWEVDVLSYLQNKSICTISELLTKAIQIELAKQNRAEQMRLSDILRRNGWVKASKQKRIEGKPQWYWEKVVTGCDGVMTEVMTPSNPCSTTVLDTVSQPVTTFLPKHSQNINVCADSEKVDISGKVENQGSDTCLDNAQNPSEQSLEGVTTFPNRGCDTPPKLEKVTDEDAQNLRDIALLWWPEYYPEQIQGLITQMYGWQAPGTKYDVAVIAAWLATQDELIRDRITELIHRRGE
jgi:predicted P-loop ATPase